MEVQMESEIEIADRNISKILNPNNAYERRQKEILQSIFDGE